LYSNIKIMKQIIYLLIPLLFAGWRNAGAASGAGSGSGAGPGLGGVGPGSSRPGSSGPAVRAERDFLMREGDGKDEKWYKTREGFLAEFVQAGREGQYFYDHKGNLLYSILTFGEKGLPEEVRRMVRSTYYDYSIGWVKQVSAVQDFSYIVHVENETSWKDVVVQDGEMREWHAFEKIK
jgi:hypothetical protein